jgi:hypothetical protein
MDGMMGVALGRRVSGRRGRRPLQTYITSGIAKYGNARRGVSHTPATMHRDGPKGRIFITVGHRPTVGTSSPPLPETKFGPSQRQDNTEMSCLPGRCHIHTIYRGSMTHGYEDQALRATERKTGALPPIRRRPAPTPSGRAMPAFKQTHPLFFFQTEK